MTSPFEAIATRIVNAENAFIETIARCGKISEDDAVKVMNLYLTKKLAKLDAVNGTINVKHGAYLDQDVLTRALAMANEA